MRLRRAFPISALASEIFARCAERVLQKSPTRLHGAVFSYFREPQNFSKAARNFVPLSASISEFRKRVRKRGAALNRLASGMRENIKERERERERGRPESAQWSKNGIASPFSSHVHRRIRFPIRRLRIADAASIATLPRRVAQPMPGTTAVVFG